MALRSHRVTSMPGLVARDRAWHCTHHDDRSRRLSRPRLRLNNLAIPETLNKQDYWYRVEFRSPNLLMDGGSR